jgi:photosystem II stability/assembly factor-like uncharacterized protein
MSRGARVLAAGAVALALAPTAAAEPGSWEGGGPPAPVVNVLEVDPAVPSTVYGGGVGALYVTHDGAGTWQRLPPPSATASISALEVNPVAHETLYAQSDADLYTSPDGGVTWTKLGLEGASTFALIPGAPATLLAATFEHGLQRSGDGGVTWASASAGIDDPALVAWLAVAPSDPNVAYTFSGALYRSGDGGRTWSQSSLPADEMFPFARAVDPFAPDTLYLADGLTVWRTTDGGGTWERRSNGLPSSESGFVAALVAAPSQEAVLYAVLDTGLYRTTNGGGAWQLVNHDDFASAYTWALAVDPTDWHRLYLANSQGMFVSTDAGVTFSPAGVGLPGLAMHAVAAGGDGTLVASPLYSGVYASFDGGATWRAGVGDDVEVESVESLAVDAAGRTLAGTYRGALFRSGDGGLSWVKVGRRLPAAPIWHLAPDPGRPGRVLAAGEAGVYRSGDAGDTWRRSGAGLPNSGVRSLAFSPSQPEIVYAALDSGGVYRSVDGGRAWRRAGLGRLTVLSLAVDPADPDVLYAATRSHGLWRSANRGRAWTRLADSGLTASVVIDPVTVTVLYASGADVLRSTDGGRSFTSYDEGLPLVSGTPVDPASDGPRTVVRLASVPGGAFAATWGGVYGVRFQ